MWRAVSLLSRNLAALSTIDLVALNTRIIDMAQELDTLISRVAEIETVADSAIELLADLKARLDAAIAAGDMSALAELSERLGDQAEELAQAILANTPAAG